MFNPVQFVIWGLGRVNPASAPIDGVYPIPHSQIGKTPWNYLYGTVRRQTSDYWINYYYDHHYHKSMTREQYDEITRHWPRDGYATDCQGLLDAYLTYECGEETDINANANMRLWCSNVKPVTKTSTNFTLGEALFMVENGKAKHVGWVCGYAANGEPLVMEARSLRYGVVVTPLGSRPWTHRGLMTAKFDYDNVYERPEFDRVKSLYAMGEPYRAMQYALQTADWTDYENKPLETDARWGPRSYSAFFKMINYYKDRDKRRKETHI